MLKEQNIWKLRINRIILLQKKQVGLINFEDESLNCQINQINLIKWKIKENININITNWKYPYMIKHLNFKQTKTELTDPLTTHAPTTSSVLQKPSNFAWIEQPPSKPTNPTIIYDQFIYTDNLTKKRIKISDIKTSYKNKTHGRYSSCSSLSHIGPTEQKKKITSRFTRRNSKADLQNELLNLNDCFLVLKSTETFKLDSLRQKIFKNSINQTAKLTNDSPLKIISNLQQTISGQIKEIYSKKKKIRQILQDSVKQANIIQFRKYFSDQNHKLNHKILSMGKHIPRSFNRNTIEKMIEKLSDPDKKDQIMPTFINKKDEDVQFPGQNKLRTQLIEFMKKLIRQNGQYLVTPDKNKLLYHKLYKNTNMKSMDLSAEFLTKNITHEQVSIDDGEKNIFNDQFISSKVDINIPTEKTILGPILNEKISFKKDNNWCRSLRKTSCVKIAKNQKKHTEYLNSGLQRKQRHRKQNTCINFTNELKPLTKQNNKPESSEITSFLNDFKFSPWEKNRQISMIKFKFQKNKKLYTTKMSLKDQKFIFMVENGMLYDVEKQILLNQDYLFMKDKNENNLLHISAKNHNTEMFMFVIERLIRCGLKDEMREKWGDQILIDKLLEKNKYNKNVFDVAQLYQAQQINQYLKKFKQETSL